MVWRMPSRHHEANVENLKVRFTQVSWQLVQEPALEMLSMFQCSFYFKGILILYYLLTLCCQSGFSLRQDSSHLGNLTEKEWHQLDWHLT